MAPRTNRRFLVSLLFSIAMTPASKCLAEDAVHTTASPTVPSACQAGHIEGACPAPQIPAQACNQSAYVCPSQTAAAAINTVSTPVMCQPPPVACPSQTVNASNPAFNVQSMCQSNNALNSAAMTAAHSEMNAHAMCQSQHVLDLSSTNANTAAAFLGSRTVNINVGGNDLSVNASSALTAAQRLAAIQVLRTGQQSILLNAEGSAVGGSVTIGSRMASHISELIIPQGVSVTTISNSGTLNLSGNLSNNGNLLLGTRNPSISSFALNANNIDVGVGASISTVFPVGSLSPAGSSNLGLNLTARNNLINAGTITTNGNLNISAGGTIVNALPQANSGNQPVMQAGGNLNILSGTGAVINAGLISSLNGSINLSTQVANTNLNVLGQGGSFQALNGNIDFRDAVYTGSAETTVKGGNYLSQNLNFFGGNGEVDVDVDRVSGILATSAHIAHVKADTETLVLGKQCLTGDPTYANTGNIEIAGPITISAGAPLAIIAGGNIVSTHADAQIVNNGGTVLLIAGANIIGASSGGAAISGTDPAGGTTGDITVSLSGGTGGNIDFAALTPGCLNCVASTKSVLIDTSSTTGAGGNITLVALADGSNGGNVWLSTSNTTGDIYSWSSATDPGVPTANSLYAGGTVSIFAGADSGTSIRLADVYTSGQGGRGLGTLASSGPGTGALLISTSQASTSDGNVLIIDSIGNISSPNTIIEGTLNNANVIAGVLNTAGAGGSAGQFVTKAQNGGNGGYLHIAAGGSVSSDSILSFGGGGAGSALGVSTPGTAEIAWGGTGGDISVLADSLSVRGDVNSSGGGGSDGQGGSAGNIVLQITNDVSVSAGRIGTGLILASSGGDGIAHFGGSAFGAGGGGSGSWGGSGATAGGAAGHYNPMAGIPGAGGGGGFNGSGGGGGGATSIQWPVKTITSSYGGAGGGGGPLSEGGISFPTMTGAPVKAIGAPDAPFGLAKFYGSHGGGGGIAGGAGGIGGMTPYPSVVGIGGFGGAGVTADTIGNGAGAPNGGKMAVGTYFDSVLDERFLEFDLRGGSAGSGNEWFGVGGTPNTNLLDWQLTAMSAGGSISPGVNAGQITISAKNTFVNGTINPNNSLFAGGSILALGTGGSVNISGNLVTAGTVRAGTLNLPSSIQSAQLAASAVNQSPAQVHVPETALKSSADSNFTNALLGTRLSTDYTPQEPIRLKLPLIGGVSVDQQDLFGQSVFSSSEFTAEALSNLASSGVKFGEGSGGNFLDLIKGYVFFLPTRQIKVQTREGLVTVPAGAACWIMETGADVAIFDFHDSGRTGPITVESNNKPFILSPGVQVLLTKNSEEGFNQLNPANGAIGYRRLRHTSLGDGTRAYVCEFAIPHGINNVEVIRSLLRSKEPQHRKAVNKMLKNALILANLTGYDYKTSADK